MKKIVLGLFLLFIFSKTAYAGNINIYYNDALTLHKGIINDNDYVYIPLVIFKDIAGSELSWFPESQEAVMSAPVRGGYNDIDFDYIAELRVWVGKDIYYLRGLEPVTKELLGYKGAGVFEGGRVFLLNDRIMVPVCRNYEQGLPDVFNIALISGFYDGKGNLYLKDLKEPLIEERYVLMEVDPEKWVGSFDKRYIEDFSITENKDKENQDKHKLYMHIKILDKNSEPQTHSMPWIPREASYDDIYVINGIRIMYKNGETFFDKEQFMKLIAQLQGRDM